MYKKIIIQIWENNWDLEICRKSVFALVQEYFEEAKIQDKVIDHKPNRKRATLKKKLTFDGQKSGDKIQGNGDSEQCFEPNTNYKGLFLNAIQVPS